VKQKLVAVIGTSNGSEELYTLALEVGRLLGKRGAIVVCGGGPGVMEAVCRGAAEYGGTSIGFLPGKDRSEANAYVTIPIPTGMGEMRNALIVRAADAVIAIGGGAGTLSEIGFACKLGKQVFGLRTFEVNVQGVDAGFIKAVDTPEDAVNRAFEILNG